MSYVDIWASAAFVEISRYLMISGGFFVLTLGLLRFGVFRGKRHKRQWDLPTLRHEFFYSVLTSAIFGLAALANTLLYQAGWSQSYFAIEEYGWVYFVLSFPLILICHDTYFYWSHWLLHQVPFLKRVHATHHRSRDPSALASLSFAPLEGAIHGSFLVVYLTLIPTHISVAAFFLFAYLTITSIGHTGIEFYPKGFTRGRFTRFFTTPTHHNMHHEVGHAHFAIYFTWWDKVMGTEHPKYHGYFKNAAEEKPIVLQNFGIARPNPNQRSTSNN